MAFLFLLMGVLDHARGRVLARAGARLQARLDPRVLRAILERSVVPAERDLPATGLRDPEAIQRFASSNGGHPPRGRPRRRPRAHPHPERHPAPVAAPAPAFERLRDERAQVFGADTPPFAAIRTRYRRNPRGVDAG